MIDRAGADRLGGSTAANKPLAVIPLVHATLVPGRKNRAGVAGEGIPEDIHLNGIGTSSM